MRKKRYIALTIIIGALAGLALCELVVRALWSAQIIKMDNLGVMSYDFMRERSDPDLTYELKPNLDMETGGYHMVTNSDGFRDREYRVKKGPNTTRILILGDSITFGFGIKENKDIYYNLLEEELNARAKSSGSDKSFEVIGIAAPGYNTYTELSLLKKKGIKYDPDLVIFAYCLNDMRDAAYSYEYANGARSGCAKASLIKMPSWMRRLLRRSVFYSYLAHSANRFVANLGARKESKALEKKHEAGAPAAEQNDDPAVQEQAFYLPEGSEWYNIYKSTHRGEYLEVFDNYILNDLEKLSAKHDFDVVFVIFPAFEKYPAYFPQGPRYLFDDVHATLKETFEKHGFRALDLKKPLEGRKFDEIAIDDCHLSREGHGLTAKILHDYFKENLID